jgi:hypothetical protein
MSSHADIHISSQFDPSLLPTNSHPSEHFPPLSFSNVAEQTHPLTNKKGERRCVKYFFPFKEYDHSLDFLIVICSWGNTWVDALAYSGATG